MNKPLISIIIPVYNTEKYLKECIDSILNQTFKNYELIIVDDGSKDNSLKIIKSYKDKRIKVFHQKNSGQSVARNFAIKKAKGDYLLFVDSDDYLNDDKVLEELSKYIPQNDIVYFSNLSIYKDKVINKSINKDLNNKYKNGKQFLKDILNKDKSFGWYLWSYLFKTELFNDIKFPEGKIYEDSSTIFKVLLKAKRVINIDRICYCYRLTNENSSTYKHDYKGVSNMVSTAKESIDYINDLKLKDTELKTLLLNNVVSKYINAIIVVTSLKKEDKKKIFKELKDNKGMIQYASYDKQLLTKKLINTFGIKVTAYIFSIRRMIKYGF